MKNFPRQFGARWLVGLGLGLALAVSAGAAAQTPTSSGGADTQDEPAPPVASNPANLLEALYPEPSENPLNRDPLSAEFGPAVPILAPLDPDQAPVILDVPPPSSGRETFTIGGSPQWQARLEAPGLPLHLTDPSLAPRRPVLPPTPEVELDPEPAAPPEPVFKVNEAGLDEIAATLELDARLARYLVYFRTVHGPFATPADLGQVFGITDADARRWEDRGLLVFH